MRSGEDRLLEWLRGWLAKREGRAPLIGDDAALLPGRGRWVVTVDSQIEGVHFLAGTDPAIVARRLMAVNLSDLAACGAEPRFALVALNAPGDFDHRRFLKAFAAAARRYGVRLAGGDVAASPGGLVAAATLLGTLPARRRFLRRSGARTGQALWVGGTLGESAAGRLVLAAGAASAPAVARRAARRHLLPEPQLALGRWLSARRGSEGAAMDVSDGLARDLHRLCRASGVGAVVEAVRLPLARGFASLCRELKRDPLELALGGGEDYVLLFTLPADESPPAAFGATRIGKTIPRGVRLDVDGERRALPPLGWDHLAP
jgi:thiamine-monophosphate kinase